MCVYIYRVEDSGLVGNQGICWVNIGNDGKENGNDCIIIGYILGM